MRKLFHHIINFYILTNPFFIYLIAFSFAFITFSFHWSELYPDISLSLFGFVMISFLPIILFGINHNKYRNINVHHNIYCHRFNDIIFFIILFLLVINIIGTGYIPVLNHGIDYRNFGLPVIDVLFNTLSIFFSTVYIYNYLTDKRKRYFTYAVLLVLIQILLYRRGTIVWILTSWIFLYLLYKKRILMIGIVAAVLLIPVASFLFGYFGNKRSNMSDSLTLEEFKASDKFKKLKISPKNYMTYLYLSSPVANLQKNIKKDDNIINAGDLKSFIFHCIIPPSITMRLDDYIKLKPPEPELVHPWLIVGTAYMLAYHTMGWIGMIVFFMFIIIYIQICLYLIKSQNSYQPVTYAILCTAVALLVFDNILIRLDTILLLFIYPALFNTIQKRIKLRQNPGV